MKKYAMNDLELAMIIYSLKMLHHNIMGWIFLLMSNNMSLKCLVDNKISMQGN